MEEDTIPDTELHTCRICLGEEADAGNLIVPCLCSGSAKYVHRECLNTWRATALSGKRFRQCNTCNFRYIIESLPDEEVKERSRQLQFGVSIILEVLFLIVVLAAVLFLIFCFTLLLGMNGGGKWGIVPNIIYVYLYVGMIALFYCIYSEYHHPIIFALPVFSSMFAGMVAIPVAVMAHTNGRVDVHRKRVWGPVVAQQVRDFRGREHQLRRE